MISVYLDYLALSKEDKEAFLKLLRVNKTKKTRKIKDKDKK